MTLMKIDLTLKREELEGCLNSSMERKALRLARRILRSDTRHAIQRWLTGRCQEDVDPLLNRRRCTRGKL